MNVDVGAGLSLRVEDRWTGRGTDRPPVLLLHGFTGSVEAWGKEILKGLEARRRTLAVDLPGHGGSGVPATGGRMTLPSLARSLSRLLDRLGVERATWIGYSMGGRIALGATVLYPGRVDRLVLESASPGLATPEEREVRRKEDEAWARRLETSGLEAFVDDWMARPLFASQRDLPDAVRARERARRMRGSAEGLARTLRETGTGSQPSFWEDLARIASPVLLLTGQRDPKFQAIADAMADRLPDVRRVTVPGAGHAVHLEAPRAWLRAVLEFLEPDAEGGVSGAPRRGVGPSPGPPEGP